MGKFKRLVESEEGMESFRAKYRISPTVGVRYAAQGEWIDARKMGEVVIPMIAFIEGGITIPMGPITRNYVSQRGVERADTQPLKSQAQLPAPMLSGEPLRDDASLRDFNGGIGCHAASALEEALLLPKDMIELRNIKKNEVFLNCKRYLGMV